MLVDDCCVRTHAEVTASSERVWSAGAVEMQVTIGYHWTGRDHRGITRPPTMPVDRSHVRACRHDSGEDEWL